MKDLISRQKTIEEVHKYFDGLPIQGHYDMVQIIKNMPTIDAVPVVRCKDCKYSEHWYRDKKRCFFWHEVGIGVFEDGFCSYGERREE